MTTNELEYRKPIFRALVGSHNYNLQTPSSDRDYKVFTLPTFKDLYRGEMKSRQTVGTTADYDFHDIRKLPELLWKSNINFMEVLFSIENSYDDAYPEIGELIERRNEIARMNLPYLFDACVGMFHNKMRLLDKGTEGTQELVDKYGYSTKQALHAYRVLDFLNRFYSTNFNDFKAAIWYEANEVADILVIKYGKYTMEDFGERAARMLKLTQELQHMYKNHKPNEDLRNEVNDLIFKVIKRAVTGGK